MEFLHQLNSPGEGQTSGAASSEAGTEDGPPPRESWPSGALEPTGCWATDWTALIRHHSHLLMAVIAVETHLNSAPPPWRLRFANDYFYHLTGLPTEQEQLPQDVLTRLTVTDQQGLRDRFRRHFLNALLEQCYGEAHLVARRWLHEPLVVSLNDPETQQRRQFELRLSTAPEGIRIQAVAPEIEAQVRACWPHPPSRSQVTTQLLMRDSALNQVIAHLRPDQYAARGLLLLEGIEVTERETSKALIQLLVGQEPVIGTSQFDKANRLIKQLFGADNSLLLIAENQRAQLFRGLDQPHWEDRTYALGELQPSVFWRATETGAVLTVADLSLEAPTQCEQDLWAEGARSLLVIPLVRHPGLPDQGSQPMMGLVGLTSTQPFAFNQADCSLATTLIPALKAAMRYSVREQFSQVHPAVRWRFEQEAERLSLGLPPVPIVFEGVYPLYGISDLRGSSDERNGAIQQDLLAQLHLALAVVTSVGQTLKHGLIDQLKLDLEDRIEALAKGVTVDTEVTLLSYLRQDVEAHFAYFAQINPGARAAIARYRAAIDASHGSVYAARARYDQTMASINGLLRDTWNRWQPAMQSITPHYCDLEATDGIDHMIYAGQAIDPNFTEFHLKALRYEQLRAMCDCARRGLDLKARYHTAMEITHLVLVQGSTVDIVHDETTERLFDLRGSRDTRYEIVKKRIDKACDAETHQRITQPGQLTVVYSTPAEWQEYGQYLHYLQREGWVGNQIERGLVEPLPGVSGLKFARVRVLPDPTPVKAGEARLKPDALPFT
ncbi:MAG TPA: GAF domain-containing protein [Leptolyngbyaceae cyanobacterium M65_K2018_010]|nr:GAF domain-containing protein [Leptolyngbyaceae cyanobacterium M65_K2018_010]